MPFFITLINVIVAIAAVLLILLVVVQSNKGSDVGLFGGSSEMVFGSQQMGALARITVVLAIIVIGGVFLVGFLKVLTSRSSTFQDEVDQKGRIVEEKVLTKKEKIDLKEPKKETLLENKKILNNSVPKEKK